MGWGSALLLMMDVAAVVARLAKHAVEKRAADRPSDKPPEKTVQTIAGVSGGIVQRDDDDQHRGA